MNFQSEAEIASVGDLCGIFAVWVGSESVAKCGAAVAVAAAVGCVWSGEVASWV